VSVGAEKRASAEKRVDIAWGVKIPMRDGVNLNATLYRPTDSKEALPAVFTMTPYISDTYHDRAMYFARNGYVFALVDVRGRGNSAGEFEPFANDARDGHDVVEWLARQSCCNGKVAMWGGSYAGFNQWSTLKEFPPHLVTIVPAAAAHPGVDFPAPHNVFVSYDVQWLTFTSGATPNAKLFGESGFWIDKFRERYLNHIPFHKLDTLVGNPSPHFQKWLLHRAPDEYLDAMAPDTAAYARIGMPILTITGNYDDDQAGAMTFYRRHMQYGSKKGRERHYLLMGPWDHAGTRTPTQEVGGLKFGSACLLDLNKLHREWYDWTMKGGAKPKFLEKRVAYYVVGAEAWKYADSLDAIPTKSQKLYLASTHAAPTDAFHSGTLTRTKPDQSPPASYVYDPLDLRPAELERESIKNEVTDQRRALNLFGNGLVFHSDPFPEAVEITGYLKLVAWIALDVPDTDFAVKVYEIKPDGTSIALADDLKRARYRESLRKEKLVKPGAIERYEFDSFNFFSRCLEKGSRLRLILSSPNSIYLEKNYNSGGKVAAESRADARTAHVALYQDVEHASYLEVPIARPSPGKEFDVLIRGGTLYDGSGGPQRRADVGIAGDRIAAVGDLAEATAKDVVEAKGLAVAPGFINMLSWSTDSLLADGRGQSEVRQGVTTQIMGEGNSWGPVNPAIKKRMKNEQFDIKYEIEWTTLSDYLTSCSVSGFRRTWLLPGRDHGARIRAGTGQQKGDERRTGTNVSARRPRNARWCAGDRLGPRVCARLLRGHRGTHRPLQGSRSAQGEVHHSHAQRRRAASRRYRRGHPHYARGGNPCRNLPFQGVAKTTGKRWTLPSPALRLPGALDWRLRLTCIATRPVPLLSLPASRRGQWKEARSPCAAGSATPQPASASSAT